MLKTLQYTNKQYTDRRNATPRTRVAVSGYGSTVTVRAANSGGKHATARSQYIGGLRDYRNTRGTVHRCCVSRLRQESDHFWFALSASHKRT